MCLKNKKKLTYLCALAVLCLALAAVLTACPATEGGTRPTPQPKGEDMTKEEVIDANAATILEHFKKVGFVAKGRLSVEGTAGSAAAQFGYVSDGLIVSISSEQYDGGGIEVTVTDEEGSTFVLPLGENGFAYEIYDGEGNVIWYIIM